MSLFLMPFSPANISAMRPCAFSKMRGGPAMKVGLMTAMFSTILSTRPSTAVGKPICSPVATSILPKTCESGSQRNWRSSSVKVPIASMTAPS